MAIVDKNIITEGLRGKVGNIIFRRRGDKTTAYTMSPRKVSLTEKQKSAQIRFAEAVALAKQAMNNETEKKKFQEMANNLGKESAYSAAVAYYISANK